MCFYLMRPKNLTTTEMKINLKKLENWWDNTGFKIYLILLVGLFIWIIIKMYLTGVHTWD
jgi:hypothetical protein